MEPDAAAPLQAADAEASAPAPSEESAPGPQPDAGVKPSSARLTRRGAAAEIERLNARIAELESSTAPPVPPDASEQERQAILDAEDRYRRLLAKPDDDPDWNQDDYVWLQDEKRRRALLPDVTRHYETVIERERRLAQMAVEQERH